MTKSPKPVDKDAVIAGLQDEVAALKERIDLLTLDRDTEKKLREENYQAGVDWRKAGQDARDQLKAERELSRQAEEARREAEGRLRFAEGYIAAVKGDAYPRNSEPNDDWSIR